MADSLSELDQLLEGVDEELWAEMDALYGIWADRDDINDDWLDSLRGRSNSRLTEIYCDQWE